MRPKRTGRANKKTNHYPGEHGHQRGGGARAEKGPRERHRGGGQGGGGSGKWEWKVEVEGGSYGGHGIIRCGWVR